MMGQLMRGLFVPGTLYSCVFNTLFCMIGLAGTTVRGLAYIMVRLEQMARVRQKGVDMPIVSTYSPNRYTSTSRAEYNHPSTRYLFSRNSIEK